ncbi:alpha/beta hydrolase [Danxiaibacter flavus]|uniref:Alpha/beta hydrolase n=1 Tax=Danxiaibacter flavus TaxID=3049108 RepID=A0ABV3ZB28_9BACT|nr:alpha/beta hydrolase [Chitinophagaceae bacterium DXS]
MDVSSKNNVRVTGNLHATETIVFGHGFGIDQTSFSAIVPAFEDKYRIVLYDNVGGGNADINAFNPSRYSSLQGFVTDLENICNYLRFPDAIYVGHSVSGMVGLLCSIKNPSFFSKIILLGVSPRYLDDAQTGYVGGFTQADLDGLYAAMRSDFQAWASGFSALAMGNPDRPFLAEAFFQTLSALRPDIALIVAKAIFESDYRKDLGKLNIPALIIQTTNDIVVPKAVGDYMNQHIPVSRLTSIGTEGHFPHMSAPEEVINAILSFI